MRNNQPVTQREHPFPDDQRLISSTDLQGTITYCNEAFIRISGYTREELIGAPPQPGASSRRAAGGLRPHVANPQER